MNIVVVGVAPLDEQGAVLITDAGDVRMLTHQGPWVVSLMLAQAVRSVRGVSAEVKECKGASIHFVSLTGPSEFTSSEVPVGDVVFRVAHDGAVEHSRHEVDPALVDKSSLMLVVDAFATKSRLPEMEEGTALCPTPMNPRL